MDVNLDLGTFFLGLVCGLSVLCGLPAALAALLRTRNKPPKTRAIATLGGAVAGIMLGLLGFLLPAQLVHAADDATQFGLFLLVTGLPAWLLALALVIMPRR